MLQHSTNSALCALKVLAKLRNQPGMIPRLGEGYYLSVNKYHQGANGLLLLRCNIGPCDGTWVPLLHFRAELLLHARGLTIGYYRCISTSSSVAPAMTRITAGGNPAMVVDEALEVGRIGQAYVYSRRSFGSSIKRKGFAS